MWDKDESIVVSPVYSTNNSLDYFKAFQSCETTYIMFLQCFMTEMNI